MDKTAKQLLLTACIGGLTSAIVPSLTTSWNWWQEKKELRPILIVSWILVGLLTIWIVDTTRRWIET